MQASNPTKQLSTRVRQRRITHRIAKSATASALSIALAACGGGGGGTVSTASQASTVTGTVAYGKPMPGAQVVAIDTKTGQTCGQTTTRADGTYTLTTGTCGTGDTLLFELVGGAPNGSPLESMAVPNPGQTVSGTVNITPLTTFYLYTALAKISLVINTTSQSGPPPAVLQSISSPNFSTTYEMAVSQIGDDLSKVLSLYGINGATFDSVTNVFLANGTGIDSFFDAYPLTAPGANSIALGSPGNYLLQLALPTSNGQTYTLSGTAIQGQSSGSGTTSSGSSNNSSSTSNEQDATTCFNPNYLQNGNSINSKYDYIDNSGNTSTVTETDNIYGPTTWNGNSAWRDQETETGAINAATTNYLIAQTNQNGVYGAIFNGYTTTYTPYYNLINYSTKVGQSYSYNVSITSDGNNAPMPINVMTTFDGIKSITVPAGNFSVCEFTENFSYQNPSLSAAGYKVVNDLAVGSGVNVQSVTTTSQGTTTLKLVSASINGTSINP